MYYVDETDGHVDRSKPGWGHPYRVFPDLATAEKYRDVIRKRDGSSSSSSSSPSSSSSNGTFVILFVVVCLALVGIRKVVGFTKNAMGKSDGFVTTKVQLNEYSCVEKEPLNKEIGVVAGNNVFKLKKVSKTKNVTWVEVYKLENDTPIVTYFLLPEVVKDIKADNKYLVYNDTSRTWQGYFDKIDAKNSEILKGIQIKFKEEIKDIEILHSSDNVLKESIKTSSFIFDKNGYFNLYKSNGTDFYYINKSDKEKFMKAYRILEKEYKNTKKEYFPKK